MNSLGIKTVTTHGTPIQLSTTSIICKWFKVKALKAMGASGTPPTSNTGYVYIMKGNVAKATAAASCVMALAKDTSDVTLVSGHPSGFDLSEYYIDSDSDGDGALISYE